MWRRPGSTRGGDWGTGQGDVDVRAGALGPVPTRQLSLAQRAGAWCPCSRRPPPPSLPCPSAVQCPPQNLCSGAGTARGASSPSRHLPCPTAGCPAAALSGQGGCWREPPGGLLELRPAPPAQERLHPERGVPCGQGLCWCSDLPSEPFFARKIPLRLLLPLRKPASPFNSSTKPCSTHPSPATGPSS